MLRHRNRILLAALSCSCGTSHFWDCWLPFLLFSWCVHLWKWSAYIYTAYPQVFSKVFFLYMSRYSWWKNYDLSVSYSPWVEVKTFLSAFNRFFSLWGCMYHLSFIQVKFLSVSNSEFYMAQIIKKDFESQFSMVGGVSLHYPRNA